MPVKGTEQYRGVRKRQLKRIGIFIRELVLAEGNILQACRAAGIKAPTTVYTWMEKYPHLARRVDQIRGISVKRLEDRMYELGFEEKNAWAAKQWLAAMRPQRWGHKTEVKLEDTTKESFERIVEVLARKDPKLVKALRENIEEIYAEIKKAAARK